jgi:hypothetical protein
VLLVELILAYKNEKGEVKSRLEGASKFWLWVSLATLFGFVFIFLKKRFDRQEARLAQSQ